MANKKQKKSKSNPKLAEQLESALRKLLASPSLDSNIRKQLQISLS